MRLIDQLLPRSGGRTSASTRPNVASESVGICECVRSALVDANEADLPRVQPEETIHPGSRQFYENEVFKTNQYTD